MMRCTHKAEVRTSANFPREISMVEGLHTLQKYRVNYRQKNQSSLCKLWLIKQLKIISFENSE